MKFLLDHDVPEDLTYLLQELDHEVLRLRDVLPQQASDAAVLQFAHEHRCVLVTCHRDDFIDLAQRQPHQGMIVIVRRRTRAAERAALFRLLERAGETGLKSNINSARASTWSPLTAIRRDSSSAASRYRDLHIRPSFYVSFNDKC